MQKQIYITPGNQYKIAETGEFIIIQSIQEKQGQTKLKDPIVHIDYYGKDKKSFTTYLNEAKRLIDWQRWIKVKI